jgi:hypothetical protein
MLSLGSHYGTYLLGPLKTSLNRELGSDNVQFSILIGSFSLNSALDRFRSNPGKTAVKNPPGTAKLTYPSTLCVSYQIRGRHS